MVHLSNFISCACRRLSSSGMSRSSGDLDKLQSRMGRSGSNSSLTVEGSSTSYRGPFGHLGADPDADFASKTVGAVSITPRFLKPETAVLLLRDCQVSKILAPKAPGRHPPVVVNWQCSTRQ